MSRFPFAISLTCLLSVPMLHIRAAEDALIFERDIQPVLAQKCGKCHSNTVRKGDLNLTSMSALRKGGESGAPALAESLDESLLWVMIDGNDMPPEGEPSLSSKEKNLIQLWIQQGAQSDAPHIEEERVLTQHDVLPILLLRCTTCHGARLREGGVDLRTPTSMRKGGTNGPALLPGDADGSLMIQRIESEACPPREKLLKFFVKRPPASEVERLREWITAGAPEADVQPDIATTEPDLLVTDEDRLHWAFQPPAVDSKVNSIDDLILEKLQTANLGFSPEASRNTLIRRVYLDLIGMPPEPAEWQQWYHHESADWYSQMIEHLLSSPHYGERWGRYWLDVAGYADSEGGVSADPIRQVAWKYRDYVISAFNEDKPYDRFLLEQIAGDELIDHENAPEITEEMVNNLVATGFLRMGIDQTGSRTMNFVPERLGVIGDVITVLGSGVMGLTLECARCHSHKYDPIPHRDYYRFKAIFQGAFDEHDWLTFKNRSLNVGTRDHKTRVAKINPQLAAAVKRLEAQRIKAVTRVQLELLRQHYPQQREADNQETIKALRIADNNRTLTQRILVEKLQKAEVLPQSEHPPSVLEAQRALADIEQEIAATRRQMEPPVTIRAVWDRGEPSPTYILKRGEHDKPGRLVGPGVPSVLTDGRTPFSAKPPFPNGSHKTGRRLAFARWLTSPDHPLTARVMVNRVWYHHFGTGLVQTLENFGTKGTPPSHPRLLDALSIQFMEQGWSIKNLHRLIMNSRTYRQASQITEAHLTKDPQNILLSRMPLRRMDAESLRDSLLSVSGALDRTFGGPPDSISVDRNGLVSVNPTAEGGWRRSIYVQYRRTEIPSMMATFDYPEMGPNCVSRTVSTVSPQSLMLMNNQRVRDIARRFAARVESLADRSGDHGHSNYVSLVYQLALSRPPTAEERQLGVSTLNQLHVAWQHQPHAALESYCHTILNSAAFLYID